jgi:hypothetical protein
VKGGKHSKERLIVLWFGRLKTFSYKEGCKTTMFEDN